MKKVFITSLCITLAVISFGQVKMPQPSPTQTIKQDFATGMVELTYSRPAAKGRKVFGDLVPYNKIWRTGANAAVQIKFSEPVEIGGKRIDTGTYALYTIPGEDNWDVILNKGIKNWGVAGYSEAEDIVRVKVPSMKLKDPVENFTMQFDEIKPESMELQIMWDKTAIAVPITVKIKDKIRQQLETALSTAEKKPYWQAAQFYNEWDKDLSKALEYSTKATEDNPKAYWVWLYRARIQNEMGDKAGAKASSSKSLELATADKNEDYIKLNNEFLKKLK